MSSGPFVYVPNEDSNTVSVIDTSTNSVVATIPVQGTPDTTAVSPNGLFVYVACESGFVSVIDTATNTVTANIPAGASADFIAFSPDSSRAYVTHFGQNYVSVIDTTTNSVIANITAGSGTYSVAVSPDGSHAYVTNEFSGTVSVIDTATNSVVATTNVGSTPTGIAVSPDGTHVYVNNDESGTVSVIDPTSNTVAATINVGAGLFGIVFSPDGSHAYVARGAAGISVIDTATNSVTASFNAGPEALGVAISPDGTHLYVSNFYASNTVTVVDLATDTIDATIAVGTYPEYLSISGGQPVIAAPDRAHVDLSNTLSVNAAHGVLANDVDPLANDTLTVSAVNGQSTNVGDAIAGAFGTLTLNADGSYNYVATHNEQKLPEDGVGLDTFTYTAKDGAGVTATTTLTIVVTEEDKTYLGGTAGATITGTKGHDAVLDGGAGKDVVVAGTGATVLIGGPGDTLTGGKAADTFVFAANFGQNTITNFNTHNDTIQLDHSEFADFQAVLAAAHQNGADTIIAHGADQITLTGVQLASLHAHDFHFV